MNLVHGLLLARFTDASGTGERLTTEGTPANAVTTSCLSAHPARVVLSDHELGLPLRHATVVTEDLVRVEVACRPGHGLAAPGTWAADLVLIRRRATALGFNAARHRAEFPATTPRLELYSAAGAGWLCRVAPSVLEVAVIGAEALWGFISAHVIRMERLRASGAMVRLTFPWHVFNSTAIENISSRNIEADERYLEAAARRLQQTTLIA